MDRNFFKCIKYLNGTNKLGLKVSRSHLYMILCSIYYALISVSYLRAYIIKNKTIRLDKMINISNRVSIKL